MKASNYRVNQPYPAVTGLKPSKRQAQLLMEGYSGASSELTTVTQYAYHHLHFLANKELAQTIKGVFLVETHHLELLGRCLIQLGEDPRYVLYHRQHRLDWQAGLVDYCQNPEAMLLADIAGEKGAAEYYVKTAEAIDDYRIAPLLLRLAEDERLHYQLFSSLHRRYFGRG